MSIDRIRGIDGIAADEDRVAWLAKLLPANASDEILLIEASSWYLARQRAAEAFAVSPTHPRLTVVRMPEADAVLGECHTGEPGMSCSSGAGDPPSPQLPLPCCSIDELVPCAPCAARHEARAAIVDCDAGLDVGGRPSLAASAVSCEYT